MTEFRSGHLGPTQGGPINTYKHKPEIQKAVILDTEDDVLFRKTNKKR